MTASIAIDAAVLEHRIHVLGDVGRSETGLFRPVYGDDWLAARALVEDWMRAAGLTTRVDPVGNLFGRIDGEDAGPVVMTGSHIDTVPDGGRYDGALGVLAALSAAEAIGRAGIDLRRPIEVVALCEEEGSRFDASYWGARAIAGEIDPDEPDRIADAAGVSIAAAMRDMGLDPDAIADAARTDVAAFVELHVEQGRVLEEAQAAIGVVEAITGLAKLGVTLEGRADHAGTTPMPLRRDAFAGAAEAALAIERIACEAGAPAVATVGHCAIAPNAANVVPARVQFSVDLRHPDQGRLAGLRTAVADAIGEIAQRRDLRRAIMELEAQVPTPMDAAIRDAIDRAATARGITARPIVSGAGHDSQVFGRRVPTAMIFTPSRDGVSHSPREFTPIEQIVPATEVLADTLVALANGGGRDA